MAPQDPPQADPERELASARRRAVAAAERVPLIRTVFDLAQANGLPIYLVGGTVRDLLLGCETHDLDFAVEGDGLSIARRVADALGGAYMPLDKERRTGRVVLGHRGTSHEGTTDSLDFAAFRGPTLEADLRDRDLTINAMALCRAADGSFALVDPLGGSTDLGNRVLRAASPLSFADDPVRTLRVVRLGIQFGCQIEAQTRDWLVEAAPRLSAVSPERIRDEWFRILAQPRAGDAVDQLQRLDLLEQIAPPLAALVGLPAPSAAHGSALSHAVDVLRAVEAVWEALQGHPSGGPELPGTARILAPHLCRRYEASISDQRPRLALLRCAALLHDVQLADPGCGAAPVHLASPERDAAHSARIACRLARSWHCSNAEADMLCVTVSARPRATQLAQQGSVVPRAIHRYYRQTGACGVDGAYLALAEAWAARAAGGPVSAWQYHAARLVRLWEAFYLQHDRIVEPPRLLSGHDLLRLGIAPGPRIGQLLAQIREEQAAGQIESRAGALQAVQAWLEPERDAGA